MPTRFRQGQRVNGQRWVLEVAERAGGKALVFEGSEALVQGIIDPARPLEAQLGYLRAAVAATCAVDAPARMLVLGLGVGALPRMLEALYPDAVLHTVELEPAVVEVAREHFGLQPGPRLQVHVADAADWVPRDPRAYDALFIDCYGPEDMPEAVSRAAFFDAAIARLAPGGVLVANILAGRPRASAALDALAERLVRPWCIPARDGSNRVVLGRPDVALDLGVMTARARALDATGRLPYRLGTELLGALPLAAARALLPG